MKCLQTNDKEKVRCLQTDDNIKPVENISFDTDSDRFVVDNSANCIIWKNKTDFVPTTYIKTNNASVGITTAVGTAFPLGIGSIRVGWYDDNKKYHNFILKGVFHVPNSPVNVLGLSTFSKQMQDYHSHGTSIKSFGKKSIFVWNNEKYQRTFHHSESNMPELPVNDGYSSFHRLCNYLETIQPIFKQCYNTNRKILNKNSFSNYRLGEEVMYKKDDYVDKAIIENISIDTETKELIYDIKFKDGRRISSNKNNIKASDETEVADIPTKAKDF